MQILWKSDIYWGVFSIQMNVVILVVILAAIFDLAKTHQNTHFILANFFGSSPGPTLWEKHNEQK